MSAPLKIFCGYDKREANGFHVFVESLLDHASIPVEIIPLTGKQRDGTNAFTYARFLVPDMLNYRGMGIFLDGSDMLVRADIAELAELYDPKFDVQVVKHDYKTQHPRKYIGTAMEADNADYPRKNWSSVVIWNLQSIRNRWITPDYVREATGAHLHRFEWLKDERIGELPPEWNVLIGEQSNPNTKIAHFTLGIPHFPYYENWDYADEYRSVLKGFGC